MTPDRRFALFAANDRHHAKFDALVTELSAQALRLLTTWPCVVEASYLLEIPQRFEMLSWIELGGAVVYPFEADDLAQMLPSSTFGTSSTPSRVTLSHPGVTVRDVSVPKLISRHVP